MFSRYERRNEALLPRGKFAKRMLETLLLALFLETLITGAGSLGFHYIEGLSWIDAALNTEMVITGNGPPYGAQSDAGKLFQMLFTLIGVVLFVLVISVVLAPVFHRVLHHFHVQDVEDTPEPDV